MCAKASHSASVSACTQATGKKKLDQAKWREATESRFAEMKSDMDGQRDVDGDARTKRKRGEGLRDTVASTSGLSGSGRFDAVTVASVPCWRLQAAVVKYE